MKKIYHHLPRYSAENIVNAAYEVLLGRSPDEAGRSAYVQRLTKGGDLKEIFKSILESDEFFNNFISLRSAHFVAEVYQGVLGREPDEAAAGFVNQVKQAGRLVPMLAEMSTSAEAWRTYVAQHAEQLVCDAYRGLFEREPDHEAVGFIEQLKATGTIAPILLKMATSEELWRKSLTRFADQLVGDAYRGLFEREPDIGAEGFILQLRESGRMSQILAEMSASQEMWQKSVSRNSEQLVRDTYRGVLGREPDENAGSLITRLKETAELTDILAEISVSEELWRKSMALRAEKLVGDVYRGLLGQDPDDNATGFVELVKESASLVPALSEISLSDELWRKSLTERADQLIGDVYRGLLGREPDEAAAGFITRVKNTADLTPVLSDIAMSDELWRKSVVHRSEQLVGEAYRGLLGRELDGNAAGFIGLLKESGELTPVLSAISSSDELWRKSVVQRSEQLVGQAYRGLLGREPDENAGGLIGLLKESAELTPVLSVITSSDELWQKNITQRAEQLIGQVYRGMLAREPDEGAAGFVGQVKDSADLTFVLSEIAASDELWRRSVAQHAEKLVDEVYRELLGRAPDSSVVAVVNRVKASASLAPVLSQIKVSDEILRQQINARSDYFVTSAYRGILGRTPDDSGMRHHINSLRSSQDFPAFLKSLTLSPEFLMKINADFQATQYASVINGLGPYVLAELDCIAYLPYLLAVSDYVKEKLGYKTVVFNRSDVSPDLLASNLNSSIAHILPSVELEGVFCWTSNRPKILITRDVNDLNNRRIADLLPEVDHIRVSDNYEIDGSSVSREDLLIFGENNSHENYLSNSEEFPCLRGVVPWQLVFKYQRKMAESQKRRAPAENLPFATVMLFLPDWQNDRLRINEDDIIYYLISLLSEHVGEGDVLLIKSENDKSAAILKRLLLAVQSAGRKAFDYEEYLALLGYSGLGARVPFEMTASFEMVKQIGKYLVLESTQAVKVSYLLKNTESRKTIHVIGGVPAQAFPRWTERQQLGFLEKESIKNEAVLRSLAKANWFSELSGSARWCAEVEAGLMDFSIFEENLFTYRKNSTEDKKTAVLFIPDQAWLVTVLAIAQDLANSDILCILVLPEKVEIEFNRTSYVHAILDIEELSRAIRWGNISIERLYVHSFGWPVIVRMLTQILPDAKLCYYADGFKNEVKKPQDMKAVEEIVYFGYKPFDWPVKSRLLSYDKWRAVLRNQQPIRFCSTISPVDACVLICLRYYGKGPYSFSQEQLMKLIWETAKPAVRPGCKILVKTDPRSAKLIDDVLIYFRKFHNGPVIDLSEEIGDLSEGPLENIIETNVLEKISSYVVFDSSLSYIIFHHPMVRQDATILVGAALESVLENEGQVAPDLNHHDKQIAQEQGIAARGLASAVKSIQYYTERYVDSLRADGAAVKQVGKSLYFVNRSDYPRDDSEWKKKYKNIKLKINAEDTSGSRRTIIGLGDSLVEMIPDALMGKYFDNYRFVNLGISGDCLPHVIWRTKQLPDNCFDSADVILIVGSNDIDEHSGSAEYVEALHIILWDEIRKKIPKSRIFVVSLLSRQEKEDYPFGELIKAVNSRIKLAAENAECIFVDVHDLFLENSGSLKINWMPDEINLSDSAYDKFVKTIRKKFIDFN